MHVLVNTGNYGVPYLLELRSSYMAALGLAGINSPESIDALLDFHHGRPRAGWITTLGVLAQNVLKFDRDDVAQVVKERLTELLEDPSPERRQLAIHFIASTRDPQWIPTLTEVAATDTYETSSDPSPRYPVREEAERAIDEINAYVPPPDGRYGPPPDSVKIKLEQVLARTSNAIASGRNVARNEVLRGELDARIAALDEEIARLEQNP